MDNGDDLCLGETSPPPIKTSARKRRASEYKRDAKRRKRINGVKERLRGQRGQLTAELERVNEEKDDWKAKCSKLER